MAFYATINNLAPKFMYLSNESFIDTGDDKDFPPSEDPVYILGKKYSSLHELSEIRFDVRTRVWMTYRRNFPPIGDSGFTADSGWGCMLRTGQMILAQALINLNIGRDWTWDYLNSSTVRKLMLSSDVENEQEYANYCKYRKILRLFSDNKVAPYSIHQIALMGACERKKVGDWFGPNTVAQVLKKLSIYDKMNDIYIHVVMDNMLFIDDIKNYCKSKQRPETSHIKEDQVTDEEASCSNSKPFWRPLILFIPLRLGLAHINPIYFRALKSTFIFPQSLGILGGTPKHALYLIGCSGDDLIYLDPHYTQPAIDVAEDLSNIFEFKIEKDDSFETFSSIEMDDASYHCERASRMPISQLDPSISLCFLCKTEEEFDQWANLAVKKLLKDEKQPLFEIMKERPSSWFDDDPQDKNQSIKSSTKSDTGGMSDSFTQLGSDDEFEII